MNTNERERKSPFLVDLVAENERIDEEQKVLVQQQLCRRRKRERRREEIKNAIILRALEETNEVAALRREKRNILEEEKRLKALIEIEKTRKADRKGDRIAAMGAERHRLKMKRERRREINKQSIDERKNQDIENLRVKHDIKNPPDNTFNSGAN